MNIKLCVLLGVAGLLVGCTTMTPQERRAADENTCRSYGFRAKTDSFANCLMRLDLDRRADRRAFENRTDFYDRPVIFYQPVYRPVAVRAAKE